MEKYTQQMADGVMDKAKKLCMNGQQVTFSRFFFYFDLVLMVEEVMI